MNEEDPLPDDLSDSSIPWARRSQIGIPKAIAETLKLILFKPREFFSLLNEERPIQEAYLFYVAISIPLYFINMLLSPFSRQFFASNPRFNVFALIWILVGIFLIAGMYHMFVRLVGGQGTYKDTFEVLCYANAASVFSLLPIAGTMLSLGWTVYVSIIGFMIVHRLSTAKASLAYCSWIFVLTLLFILQMLGGNASKDNSLNPTGVPQESNVPVLGSDFEISPKL